MTREETQNMINVMQHYADGGEVECIDEDGNWFDTSSPEWSEVNGKTIYRIKPDTKSEDLLNRFFGDLKTILDDPKVDSSNLFEHLGKKFKP